METRGGGGSGTESFMKGAGLFRSRRLQGEGGRAVGKSNLGPR